MSEFEITLKKLTIRTRRYDRRSGLRKLKGIIFFLREHFHEKDLICYDDVEFAINEVTEGLDHRTIKKYIEQLLRFHYLEPRGAPKAKTSTVTIQTHKGMHVRRYYKLLGHQHYIFGLHAPKRYVEPSLDDVSIPPVPPLSDDHEGVRSMLDRVGVTSKTCVRNTQESDVENIGSGETGETSTIERKEEEDTTTHTRIHVKPNNPNSHEKNTLQKTLKNGFTTAVKDPGG